MVEVPKERLNDSYTIRYRREDYKAGLKREFLFGHLDERISKGSSSEGRVCATPEKP